MEFVTNMGGVWRLSDAKFRRLTRDLAAGRPVNLDDYGTMLCGSTTALSDLEDAARGDDG